MNTLSLAQNSIILPQFFGQHGHGDRVAIAHPMAAASCHWLMPLAAVPAVPTAHSSWAINIAEPYELIHQGLSISYQNFPGASTALQDSELFTPGAGLKQ
jgi:hypothetical protein